LAGNFWSGKPAVACQEKKFYQGLLEIVALLLRKLYLKKKRHE
jgi:hypothetical protein